MAFLQAAVTSGRVTVAPGGTAWARRAVSLIHCYVLGNESGLTLMRTSISVNYRLHVLYVIEKQIYQIHTTPQHDRKRGVPENKLSCRQDQEEPKLYVDCQRAEACPATMKQLDCPTPDSSYLCKHTIGVGIVV